jgi:hypothetical protein
MIRRDYILRMIEEFIQALARINSLKKGQRWDEAAEVLDAEFTRLVGSGAEAVAQLSETELLARLLQGEPTHVVRHKTLVLTALLKEAGDVAVAQERIGDLMAPDSAVRDERTNARPSLSPSPGGEGRGEGEPARTHFKLESRECYLKALHLLLETLAQGEVFECPDFVPKVEMLKEALQGTPLPVRTHAMLMQHYERTGEFSKAEDALFAMLDAEPDNTALIEFAIAFYERLLAQSDSALAAASLPRVEVGQGLKELQNRRARRFE